MAEKKSTEKSYKSRKPAATPAKKTTTQTTKKTVTKTPVDKEKELAKKKKEQEAIERVLANAEAKKKTTSTKKKTTTTTKKTTKSSTTAKATSSRKPSATKTATKTTPTKQKEVKQVVEPKVSQTKVEAKSKVTEKKKVEEKKVETTNLDDLQKKIKEEKSKLDKKIEKKILDDVIANAVQKEVQEDIKPREIDTELIKDMVPRTEPISTKPQDESIRRRRTVTEDEYKEIILSSIAAAEKEIEEPVEEEKVQEDPIEEDVEQVMDDTGIIPIVGEAEEHPPVKIHYHNEDVDFDETIQLEKPITEEITSEEKEEEVIEQLEVEDEVIEQLEVEEEEKVEEEQEEVIETKVKEPKLKHKKKGKKLTNAISIIMGLIFIISTGLVYGLIQYLDVLPAKYSILFTVLTVLYTLIVGFMLLNVKVKKGIKIFFIVLALISTAVCTAISYFGLETLEFFKKVSEVDHSVTEKYYVMVKKDSKYTKLEDIENISLATFNENTNVYKQAIEKLNDLVETTLVTTESSFESIEWLLNDEISVILLSNIHKEAYEDDHNDFKDKVNILHTIEVKTNGLEEEVVTIKPVSEDIMTIYIAGIDTYGNINLRSRSDVNMLVTVNKKNHEILMTSIPRDYYVPLHTYGGNDKLTHAGIYGVNESIQTIQDFMGIDINYYVRVNFSTLEAVVNSIGGVEVYSDMTLRLRHHPTALIRQGMNHMDGKTALAFARERYAYSDGDRHRVRNQQEVLKAIINKVTSNPTILTRYSSILGSISPYFQTNFDMNEVSDIVKIQLDKMPSWTIKQYSLDGTGSSQVTYSMGSQRLYVMVPNTETVATGSKYINGMAKGKTFAELGLN